jgi:hypothetical protein
MKNSSVKAFFTGPEGATRMIGGHEYLGSDARDTVHDVP